MITIAAPHQGVCAHGPCSQMGSARKLSRRDIVKVTCQVAGKRLRGGLRRGCEPSRVRSKRRRRFLDAPTETKSQRFAPATRRPCINARPLVLGPWTYYVYPSTPGVRTQPPCLRAMLCNTLAVRRSPRVVRVRSSTLHAAGFSASSIVSLQRRSIRSAAMYASTIRGGVLARSRPRHAQARPASARRPRRPRDRPRSGSRGRWAREPRLSHLLARGSSTLSKPKSARFAATRLRRARRVGIQWSVVALVTATAPSSGAHRRAPGRRRPPPAWPAQRASAPRRPPGSAGPCRPSGADAFAVVPPERPTRPRSDSRGSRRGSPP